MSQSKMHTKKKGDSSVAHILATFVAAGISVAVPWGDNDRYDLVAEDTNGKLLKIQCKTARALDSGTKLCVPLKSINYWKDDEAAIRTYEGQVDLIAAWSPDTKRVYLVSPVGTEIYLRLQPTRNNQSAKVKWAQDYEFKGTLPI